VIKVLEVKRENGKVIMVVALINNYIESTWIRLPDDRIVEVSRINYDARFLKNLYIEKEEYKKMLKVIYAIFNGSNKTGRK
jgi:GT2 family glycosyltransferase